jgi:hypothetical protein
MLLYRQSKMRMLLAAGDAPVAVEPANKVEIIAV